MLIPLGLTIYFSLLRYNLLMPGARPFVGWENYEFFITNPAFTTALINTLLLVGGVLLITVIGGVLLALLLNLEIRQSRRIEALQRLDPDEPAPWRDPLAEL